MKDLRGPLGFFRLCRGSDGQASVIAALCMVVLLGFLALSTDVAILLHEHRIVQAAADAAAVAGAYEIQYASVDGTTVAAVAQAAASQNGITNGSNSAVVTVNNGPLSGPHAGDNNYVEAIVNQPTLTFFMQLFQPGSMAVTARAVAGLKPGTGCIYTLGTSGTDLTISSGSAYINAPDCNVLDDSTGSTALSLSGGSYINANSIGIASPGGHTFSGGSTTYDSGSYTSPKTNVTLPSSIPSFTDPLASLPEPSTSPCTTTVISNGSYSQGCFAGLSIPAGKSVSLSPGLYVINGDFTVSASGSISGSGVTFYITGKATFSGGSSSTSLSAPTSGVYDGILFFTGRSDTQTFTFSGGSGGNVDGIIYVPDANLTLSGGSTNAMDVDLITKTLTISGGSTIGNYANLNSSTALSTVRLVE